MAIEITRVTSADVDEELVAAFARLLPQLSVNAALPGADRLREVVATPGTALLIARDGPAITGSLAIAIVELATGTRALIEDVVVDDSTRGRGVGRLLVEAALDHARREGAAFVDLTSNPSRVAANALYQRAGFEQRTTNVYRFTYEPGS